MAKRIFPMLDGSDARKRSKLDDDVLVLQGCNDSLLSLAPTYAIIACAQLAELTKPHDVSIEWFIPQRSELWFALRDKRITGSKLASVVGASRSSAPVRDVWRAWCGLLEEWESDKVEPNEAMEYGVVYEDRVAVIFCALMWPLPMRECGFFVHRDMHFMGVSPDGILGPATIEWTNHVGSTATRISRTCKVVVLEIKTSPYGVPAYPKTEHVIQTHQEMALTNATYCFLPYWHHSDGWEYLRMWRIDFSSPFWSWILRRAIGFHNAVKRKRPLPPFLTNVPFELYEHWYPYNPCRRTPNKLELPDRPPMALVFDGKRRVQCTWREEHAEPKFWPKEELTHAQAMDIWPRVCSLARPTEDADLVAKLLTQNIGYDTIEKISVDSRLDIACV